MSVYSVGGRERAHPDVSTSCLEIAGLDLDKRTNPDHYSCCKHWFQIHPTSPCSHCLHAVLGVGGTLEVRRDISGLHLCTPPLLFYPKEGESSSDWSDCRSLIGPNLQVGVVTVLKTQAWVGVGWSGWPILLLCSCSRSVRWPRLMPSPLSFHVAAQSRESAEIQGELSPPGSAQLTPVWSPSPAAIKCDCSFFSALPLPLLLGLCG